MLSLLVDSKTLKRQSRLQQTTNFATSFVIFTKNDTSWEFLLNIMPYLLFLKKEQILKLSAAANYRWFCLLVLLLYIPSQTAMVMAGWSVHHTFSWASLNKEL